MSPTAKGAFITGVFSVIVCVLEFFLTQTSVKNATVETLSQYFESVQTDMSYEKALSEVYEELERNNETIYQMTQQITELEDKNTDLQNQAVEFQTQMSIAPQFDIKSPALILNGLKIQDSVDNSVISLNGNHYYSERILDMILDHKPSYDSSQNTVLYSDDDVIVGAETKIDLCDTNVLYDGTLYRLFMPSDGDTFSMGSNSYNKGFILCDDHSLFGEGDGYALFDLQGKYSKVSFDVGRTNEYEKQDVTLKVYLDNEYIEEYALNAQSPPVTLTIDLNYANNLKLEITGGSRVKYGFANVILHY